MGGYISSKCFLLSPGSLRNIRSKVPLGVEKSTAKDSQSQDDGENLSFSEEDAAFAAAYHSEDEMQVDKTGQKRKAEKKAEERKVKKRAYNKKDTRQ